MVARDLWDKVHSILQGSTIKELALKEQVEVSYVAEVLRLTLLAPDLVELILDGRRPPGWQLREFRKSVPIEWQAQRDTFGRQT